jgi:hypothetical protein
MIRLRGPSQILHRHRRATALAGILIVLGVVALNAHAALPEHHEQRGVATICIASLSIAVLAAALTGTVQRGLHVVRLPRLVLLPRPRSLPRPPVRPAARAGPPFAICPRRR